MEDGMKEALDAVKNKEASVSKAAEPYAVPHKDFGL